MKEIQPDEPEDNDDDFKSADTKKRPKKKSMLMKRAVFKVMEQNEQDKNESFKGLNNRGFIELESNNGQYRYKLGLIDFLTEYSVTKLVENRVKSTLAQVDKSHISAIDQLSYQKRFIQFMRDNL